MQSNDRIRVQHILDEACEACKYAEGISFDELKTAKQSGLLYAQSKL